jgi:hypothetical protein
MKNVQNAYQKSLEREGLIIHYRSISQRDTQTHDGGNTTDKLDCLDLGTTNCEWPDGDPCGGVI